MYFNHKVDAEKLRKIARLELPAIEVDLSDMDVSTGFDSITQRVVHDASHKSWLFFPNQEEERKRLRSKLARRIRLINSEQRTRDAAVRERRAAEERKLREAFTRRQEAARRYREMSFENKELDLRKRLGIIGRWPYYLQKASLDGNAIQEKPMIWQAALFARFVFKKANLSYDLDYKLVLSWVLERFDTGSNSIDSVSVEVKRYLAYLCACGFLRKLPVYRHKGQCYVVVHGELVPPKRVEESKKPPLQAPVPAEMVKPVRGQHEHWIWRASWPMWNDICEKAGELIAASSHGELLEALLHELSPFRRPDEPLECAAIMKIHGVSQAEVMSFLESLGLVLKSSLPGRDRPTNR
ncbi:hypothetical protein F1609_31205 [Massilia sp. CCM 8693]|uniref:Replication protein n=2 Tax=Massilia aquatica TaxID=2609000 RepID=A0ABX0MC15_9BURK|nr:hypothetical protein [Massilia aquatica]